MMPTGMRAVPMPNIGFIMVAQKDQKRGGIILLFMFEIMMQ